MKKLIILTLIALTISCNQPVCKPTLRYSDCLKHIQCTTDMDCELKDQLCIDVVEALESGEITDEQAAHIISEDIETDKELEL